MFVIFYLLCAVDDSYDTYSWLRKFETRCSDYILRWGSWEVIQVKATRDTSPPGFLTTMPDFQDDIFKRNTSLVHAFSYWDAQIKKDFDQY